MEQKINISILQMSSSAGEVKANIQNIENIIRQEFLKGTDVLVLPEVWTVGWVCKYFHNSEKYSNIVLDFLCDMAKKYNVNIIGGSFINKIENKFYNTCPVINRKGKIIAQYSKNHLYSYYGCEENKYIEVGKQPVMVDIDGVKYGLTICYDIRFPEIYRAYRLAGADVLVNCAAWGATKPIPWDVMTKSRAVENQCYMVALTQCGEIENGEFNLGKSSIIDYKGEELVSINQKQGIVGTTIDLSEMYDFRSKCTVLNDIKENYEVELV